MDHAAGCLAIGALLASLGGAACGASLEDEDLGEVDDSEFGGSEREGVIEPEGGFAGGEAIDLVHWDLRVTEGAGLTVVETPSETDPDEIDVFAHVEPARMYVFFDANDEPLLRLSGDGTEVRGQYPIVDRFGASGVSGLWEVVAVGAPSDYEENEIKSTDTLFAADLGMQLAVGVVACIPVANDASLASPEGTPAAPRLPVWFRKRKGICVLADGGGILLPGGAPTLGVRRREIDGQTVLSVLAMPLYDLRAAVFGREEPIEGNRLVDALPPHSSYAPLVTTYVVPVPADYEVGTLTSFDEVDEALVEVDRDLSGRVVVQMVSVLGAPE